MEILNYTTEMSLFVITIVIGVIIYKWHTSVNNHFDLSHALMGEDNKVSLYKIGQATALVVSTWAFVTLVQRDKLTEYYFYGYMGIWSGINLAKNLFGKAPDGGTNKT